MVSSKPEEVLYGKILVLSPSSFDAKGALGLVTPAGGGPDGGDNQLDFKYFIRSKLAGSNEDEWFAFL